MEFEFTGKIDSATFVDRQNTTIEILFKRDNELYAYNLPVDYAADDFKAFLEEWSLEKVERETRITRRAADETFDQMIQGRVAEELAKGQGLLDEQDKRRYAIAQHSLDDWNADMAAYKKKLEADVDVIDKERYKLADEYKKALEDKVDKNEQERIELWRLNNPTNTRAVAPSDLLMYADKFNDNKSFLFDLKLAIFEDPAIANIKDKDVKLQIRKAKSIYEALELYCKLKKNYVQTVKNVI
tara:strand:- start:456 stop:1181 length:726 start_codon:yes stop_codon:yes gene_type:complete